MRRKTRKMPKMYAPPILRMPERSFPMLKRKAMVRSRIEKAQGLMLSISAETITSGKSHFPPLLKFQTKVVPALSVFRKNTKAKSRTAMPAKIIKFLLMVLRSYRRRKFKLKRFAGAIFQIHSPFYPADSSGPVRGRVKYHLNCRFFVWLNYFVDALSEAVSGHAEGSNGAAADFKRCFGAHAGSVKLADGKSVHAGIFYRECF